jgi:hypothetical protein
LSESLDSKTRSENVLFIALIIINILLLLILLLNIAVICHVIKITYQTIEKTSLRSLLGGLADNQLSFWMNQNGWKDIENGFVFISNQDENIKTKNITEKIDLENVAQVIAAYR